VSYSTFSVKQEGALMRVTLSNPPVNLMTFKMVEELFQLCGALVSDKNTRVVLFDSADKDFFVAHFDLNDIVAAGSDPSRASKYPDINALQSLGLAWQALPQITIAKIAGRCRGAGLEFVLALTMRFASEHSKFCAPEAAGGFLACGGGTTRLSLLAGPSRAMEIMLSGRDFSGAEAERYGIINRALPAAELDAYVNRLATAIAQRSGAVIAMHQDVHKKLFAPMTEQMFAALAIENDGFRTGMAGTEMVPAMMKMLALKQAREVELDLPASIARVNGTALP
jgi:enoyl-CoA hydratase/carnithine racemase